jgi:hypothetical protein
LIRYKYLIEENSKDYSLDEAEVRYVFNKIIEINRENLQKMRNKI